MSSIDRLFLQGIRSFGPDDTDEEEINFATPLTLIVGKSGSGKTTIIEALKYATCGELPAGTKGNAFLYDPNLRGRTNVKSHVELHFHDEKGRKKTITRTAQITLKANKKPEFKTLDSIITNEHGEHSIIDSSMENGLGVSKAILSNVIFCSQDDSSWPLEKGTKIKERFEAIFGITEYNRWIDYMRQLAKIFGSDKPSAKHHVNNNGSMRKDSEEKAHKMETTKSSLLSTSSCSEVADFKKELAFLKNRFNKIFGKETDLELDAHFQKVQTRKDEWDSMKENEQDLWKKIQIKFNGNDEELLEKIFSFEKHIKPIENKLQKLKQDKDFMTKEETHHLSNIVTKEMQLRTLQNQNDQNDERVRSRNLGMNELAAGLKLPVVPNSDMNQDRATEILNSIEQKLKKENLALSAQEDLELKKTKVKNEMNPIQKNKDGIEREIQMKQKNIQDNKNEIAKIKKKIEDVDKSTETLTTLKKELVKINNNLALMKSMDVNQCKTRINENTLKIERLEFVLSELGEEIKTFQNYRILQKTLDQYLEDERKTKNNFDSLLGKHSMCLKHLLNEVPQNDFEKKVQTCCDRISTEIIGTKKCIADIEERISILIERNSDSNGEPSRKRQKLDKISKLGAERERLLEKLKECPTDLTIAQALLLDCKMLDHLYQNSRKVQQDIEEQRQKISTAGIGMSTYRKMQDAQNEEDSIKVQLTACRKELKKAQDDLFRYQETLNRLTQEKIAINDKMIKRRSNIEQKKELCDNVEKLEKITALYKYRVSDLEKDRNSIIEKLNKLSLDLKRMNVDHEMKIDKKKKMLHEFNKKFVEISNLHRTIKQYNEKGGASRLDKIRQELTELQLTKETNTRRKERIDEEIQSIKQVLQVEEMKKIDFENNLQYRQKQNEISKLGTQITDDLKQCEKKLDCDMIYFHKESLKKINAIVCDLWNQVYRGNDIDTIEIKTDEPQLTTGGKRSYNYRVVQLKNDTELDIAGRCSAGEKVLACLIIRMALLEIFSKNCGIFTLDEPTINLDCENVEMLSSVLSNVVAKRMKRKNFQLIVITQNPEFLKNLTSANNVDHYLTVFRNDENISQVKKIKL